VRHPLLRAVLWHRTDPPRRERIRAALRLDLANEAGPAPSPAERRRPGRLGDAQSGASDVAKLRAVIDQMDGVADADEAAGLLNALAVRFYWSPPDGHTVRSLMAIADSVGLTSADPRQLHLLATTDPIGHGAVVLRRLARLSQRLESSPYELHLLGIAANAVCAYDFAATFHAACVPGLQAQGRQAVLARALTAQAWAAAQLGDTRLGSAAADAAQPLGNQTHQPIALVITELARAFIAALRGDGTAARSLATTAEQSLDAASVPYMLAKVRLVRGVAALGERRYDEAFDELRRIFDNKDPAHHPYIRFCALGPLAEAGSLGGRRSDVADLADELEPVAARGRSPMLCHGLRYARAVVATAEEAPERFREALGHDLSGWPFERARLELAYGTWLRRQRRPAEARDVLRSAIATFDALGVAAWGTRARLELRSVGGPASGSGVGLAGLTEQQRRVAHLAAAGLTNREIAERLYLSPRTVTTHLSRIYATVAAGSRADLARILASEATTDT
jgi:DNA-binding CsgD family transcriptional regulator